MSFWKKLFTLGADETYDRAMDYYNQCHYKEAIGEFERIIQRDRGKSRLHKELATFYKSQAHRNFGITLMHEGRFDDAVVSFKMALEILPESTVLHSHLGICYNNSGRYNNAIVEFEKVLADKETDVQSRIRLGLALRNQGLYNRAIDQFHAAINVHPKHADLHYFLGLVLCNKNNYKEAAEEFKHALEINPNYAEVRSKLHFLDILLKEDPSSSQAIVAKNELFKMTTISLGLTPFISTGVSKKDIGLCNTLIYVYNKILKEHPNYADIYFKLSQIYESQEKFEEAECALKKALQINPDFIQARINLGFLYKEMSRFEAAAKEFSYVVDKNLPYPIVAFSLGLVYKRLNKTKEAARAFEMALQFDPAFEEAKTELKKISS